MKKLPRKKWEDCLNCSNVGCFGIEHPIYTDGNVESMGYPVLVDIDIEQVQCEFCWTNPKSVFFQANQLWKNEKNCEIK